MAHVFLDEGIRNLLLSGLTVQSTKTEKDLAMDPELQNMTHVAGHYSSSANNTQAVRNMFDACDKYASGNCVERFAAIEMKRRLMDPFVNMVAQYCEALINIDPDLHSEYHGGKFSAYEYITKVLVKHAPKA